MHWSVLISEVQISEVPLYTPEWVQIQGLYSGHYNLIRYYMRVKKTVMHLHVSMLSPPTSLLRHGLGG